MSSDRPTPHDQPDKPGWHRPDVQFTDGVRRWSDLELRPDTPSAWDRPGIADHPERPRPETIRLTPDRLAHVLDGDEHGGGHLHGTGIPGKCEFPEHWDDDRISAAVLHTAVHPQYVRQKPSGGWEVSRDHEDVTVWAVVRNDGRIWTAYPDPSSPAVTRNPRPRRSDR